MEPTRTLPVVSDVFPSSSKPAKRWNAQRIQHTQVHTPGGFDQALEEGRPAPRSARISRNAALDPQAIELLVNSAPPYRPRPVTVFVPESELRQSPRPVSPPKSKQDEDTSLSKKLASALGFQTKRSSSPERTTSGQQQKGKRPGLISSESDPYLAPRTWRDFNQLYVEGGIDLSKPPEPPVSIASRFPSPNFPQKEDSLDSQFAAPISPLEIIRQKAIARYKALIPAAPSDTSSPAPSVEAPSLAHESTVSSSNGYSIHTPSHAHHSQYHSFSTLIARIEGAIPCRWLAISLMLPDDERFLASKGFPAGMKGIPREISLAAHAILRDEPMIVDDVAQDWRFQRGPLAEVIGVRSYAGFPLFVPTSSEDPRPIAIGVLSGFHNAPRRLSSAHILHLHAMAAEISRELERLASSPTLDMTYDYVPPPPLNSMTAVKPRNMTALERRFVDWRTQLAIATAPPGLSGVAAVANMNPGRVSSERPAPQPVMTARPSQDSARSIPMDRRSVSIPPAGPAPRGGLPAVPESEPYRRPSVPDAFAPATFSAAPQSRLRVDVPKASSPLTENAVRNSAEDEERTDDMPTPTRLEQFADAQSERNDQPFAMPSLPEGASDKSITLTEAEQIESPDRKSRVYEAACKTVGRGMNLDFVYIVSVRYRPLLFASGQEEIDLDLLASYQLEVPSPHFQVALHLRALRSEAGGLLYRNPSPTTNGGFAGGILLPIIECTPEDENCISGSTTRGQGEALLICAFWRDPKRQFSENELHALSQIADRIKTSLEDDEI